MSAMQDVANKKVFVIPTKGEDGSIRAIDGTGAIAISFVFLAYFLHPAIEKAYNRVRAYRAWRAIEKREQVEVTSYSMTAEVFGARGIWDAARVITFLLAAFSLASWGLELRLEIADIEDGPVNLLNAPPPVILRNDDTWEVMSPSDDLDAAEGSLSNMDGDYFNGKATSRYHVEGKDDMVNGQITVAWWSEDVNDGRSLFYNIEDFTTTVDLLNCSSFSQSPANRSVFVGGEAEEPWGTVDACEAGPLLSNTSQAEDPDKPTTSPPTIILTSIATGAVHMIVEESSSSPSFLYSVWTSGHEVKDGVEIHHVFHIASTMRLAEAVVTGIVHGLDNGGGCFGLLRQYSENHFADDEQKDVERASPFGEKPNFGEVDHLNEVEAVEDGVEVNVFVLLCAVWLIVLTSIGFAWSLCLRKSIGMDIYDRDELIRAVSMPATASGADASDPESTPPPSSIRIFVRKEDAGHMSVAVSEAPEGKSLFERLCRRGRTVSAHDEPAPVAAGAVNEYNAGFGGAALPVGPQTVWLEGQRMRTGTARAFPGPDGNFLYPSIALTASPVPSTVGSLAGTPAWAPSPIVARTNPGFRRGPSVMFEESVHSSGNSSTQEEDVETGRCVRSTNGGGGDNSSSVCNGSQVAGGENSPGESNALGTNVQTGTRVALSGATTPGPSGGSSPVPSRGLTRSDLTLGPAQMSGLLRADSERTGPAVGNDNEVKECGESKVAVSGATLTPGASGGSSPVPSRGLPTTDFTLGPAQMSCLLRAASERVGADGRNKDEAKECSAEHGDDGLE